MRVLLGGLLGGVVMFVWGFVFWVVLPFAKSGLPELPNQAAVMKVLDDSIPADGTYVFPARSHDHDAVKAAYAKGPVGTIAFHKGGADMEDPTIYLKGLLHFAACSVVLAGLMSMLSASLPTYRSRVFFAFCVGLFAAVAIEGAKPIWWNAPGDFIVLNCAYHVVGWALAGFAIAAVVKPTKTA